MGGQSVPALQHARIRDFNAICTPQKCFNLSSSLAVKVGEKICSQV